MRALTGARLRERRLALGVRQADAARAAGISASYLNLIEHDRRPVGAQVLARLAEVLGVGVETLEEGAEAGLIVALRAAAGEVAGASASIAEVDRLEDFIGRFPGWAAVLAQTHQRAGQLERAVAALNDRITHDPHLSQALHEVLSAVSSVRSTAAILAETEDIAPEWRARFHGNLHEDSERLALGAEALVAYLDGSEAAEEAGAAAPQELFDDWLAARGWHLAALEDGGDIEAEIAALPSLAAQGLARDWARVAAGDVTVLPLAAFQTAVAELEGDPARIAARFGCGILPVMRRMATLPAADAGLVICDASGTLIFRKPAAGFALPRFGAACALWPLYTALSRPMEAVAAQLDLAGRGGQHWRALAYCQPELPQGFGGPQLRYAAMLLMPEAGGALAALRVGSTCRICPETGCPARREASIVTGAGFGF